MYRRTAVRRLRVWRGAGARSTPAGRQTGEPTLIAKAPRIGPFKVECPEIESWDFEQYACLLAAAKAEGPDWYAAVCLAGEAGATQRRGQGPALVQVVRSDLRADVRSERSRFGSSSCAAPWATPPDFFVGSGACLRIASCVHVARTRATLARITTACGLIASCATSHGTSAGGGGQSGTATGPPAFAASTAACHRRPRS
jgi:hypothetical protein